MDKREILKHFREHAVFKLKEFDSVCLKAHDYAKTHGFDRTDLELIVDYSLRQKMSSRRLSYMVKMLIPVTYMPDTVVRSILKWLMQNYTKNPGKEAVKAIFQWLIGLIEYKLTESDVIDRYYHFFYSFLKSDDNLAAKLIYLLTKPIDVNRWYVKILLLLQSKFKSKALGAILYLYKTYRPDCVPENIPAYAVQTVFSKLPAHFTEGFGNARERIQTIDDVPSECDNIVWEIIGTYKVRTQKITLIPKTLIVDDTFNVNNNEISSLRKIKSVKQLHNHMLGHHSLENMYIMPLLNNPAGRFILTFADNKIHTILNYNIYHILYDGFINSRIEYEEMRYFLQCIASFQSENQQSIPLISTALAKYMTIWDGDDHFDEISNILEFINVSSYDELYNYFLLPLKSLFVIGNLYKKCDILNTIGNIILNIVLLKTPEGKHVTPIIFPDDDIKFSYSEMINELTNFAQELCYIGLYLEKNHCLLHHCITNLYLKIITIEYDDVKLTIPDDLLYNALFTCSPSNIVRIFETCKRFPNSVSKRVMDDYYCLISEKIDTENMSILEGFSKELNIIENQGVSLRNFNITRFISFSCYFLPFKLNQEVTPGLLQINNLIMTINRNRSNRKRNKKRKR